MDNFDALPHEEQLDILKAVAQSSLARYDLPSGSSVEMINLSENATYRVDTPDGGRRALRVHRDGYHTKAAIASELAWLNALREDGAVLTPTPLPGLDGELIQPIDHELIPRPRHVVMSAWEEGEEPDEEQADLREPFEELGEITARMHAHALEWERPDFFERYTWDFETSIGPNPHWGHWQDGMGLTPEIMEVFTRTVDLIEQRLGLFGKSPDRFGLVHGPGRYVRHYALFHCVPLSCRWV